MGDCEAGTGYQQSPWLDAEGCPDLLQLCIGTFPHGRAFRIEAFVENDRPSNVLDIAVWRASRHEDAPRSPPGSYSKQRQCRDPSRTAAGVPSVVDTEAKASCETVVVEVDDESGCSQVPFVTRCHSMRR